jgi:hypothetical protein
MGHHHGGRAAFAAKRLEEPYSDEPALAIEGRRLLKLLIAERQRFPELVELYRTMALSRGMALIRSILKREIAQGEIRGAPAASDPRLVIAPAIVAAIFLQVVARGVPLDRDAFLQAHLDLVLNGLRPR